MTHPLNPLDIPFQPVRYDLISMPPVSLVNNAHFEGAYYRIKLKQGDKNESQLPAGMKYFVNGQ